MANQKQDFFSQFDEWWQEIGPASRSSLDAETAHCPLSQDAALWLNQNQMRKQGLNRNQ